jgi:Family of unknown function (DUF6884)
MSNPVCSLVERHVGLVGCVKRKASAAMPARDLYTSPLFVGRRSFVERQCTEWWILSAEHGLVHPDQILAPYDLALKSLGRVERRSWSRRVLSALDERVRFRPGDVVEIHAGAEYRDYGLLEGLAVRGCVIEVPTAGLSMGRQLQFYRSAKKVVS